MNKGRPRWRPAYIGLGSNLGDPRQQIADAFDALATIQSCYLVLRSPLYRSAPVGPEDQPDYLNAAAALLTQLSPIDLLTKLQAIENAQGRVRNGQRWQARTLDLDLLIFGNEVIELPSLTVPHPRIAERNFVLLPLNDIAPEVQVPGHASVARLAARVSRTEPWITRI